MAQTGSPTTIRSPMTTPPATSLKPTPSSAGGGWPVAKVRDTFVQFFQAKPARDNGHAFVPSSPCVPHDDPTLLFANAGMNQFKPLFLGTAKPGTPLYGLKRAVNSQKCIRAGGKHNDLDDVGKDTYHHTFFEMLGNWSFGDYFKKEAIEWSWELLTKVYGIPPAALYASYFGGDPKTGLEPDLETKELWLRFLPADRVIPGSMKDNFWEMGETGPCGPCTEIHVDRLTAMGIESRNAAPLVNSGDADVIEIWNNVFIQFNREPGGELKPLPAKHVDTGMGLERLTSVLQHKRSNYDTDVFFPIFAAIERISNAPHPYRGKLGPADVGNVDTAYRVIADHIRTLTFAITDGAVPSNEGRGYVLRRILRRAVRFGRQVLSAKPGFFADLVPVVVENFGGFFPELKKNPQRVADIIREEEESFGKTLERGLKLFDEAGHRAAEAHRAGRGHKDFAVVSAEDAFKLHDTYGFPVDLTIQMAEERGMKVDVPGYEKLMDEAKDKARAGAGGKFGVAGPGTSGGAAMVLQPDTLAKLEHQNIPKTMDGDKFSGRPIASHVRAIWNGHNFDERSRIGTSKFSIGIVLDKTNFYAEMGGQESDTGRLNVIKETRAHASDRHEGGEFKVEEVRSFGGYVLHIGHVTRGEISVGDSVQCSLDSQRRSAIAANHTATHLLNHGLRAAVGDGADQKGSLVASDRLRFDFSHGKPVGPEELATIEKHVQQAVQANLSVYADAAPLFLARNITGLRAVFGEQYPDPVRVVSIGVPVGDLLDNSANPAWREASIEFCGGTHVETTRQIGDFALISEEAVAKGVRRITALTGVPAKAAIQAAETIAQRIAAAGKLPDDALGAAVQEIVQELDTITLPAVRKSELRASLAALQERVKGANKQAGAARSAEAVAHAQHIAQDALARHEQILVTTIDAAGDRNALQSAVNTVAQLCPKAAVMLMDADQSAGKVAMIAVVPAPFVAKGLKAGDWVRAASEVVGGKGGGKPEMAQGGGTDLTKVKDAIKTAVQFAHSKIG